MQCGRIALERAGIKVDKYYASEIDKYAVKVSQSNYPDSIQLGDVTKWHEWDIEWSEIDLLIGGSPCQGFSFAGKQLAFDDPRSALFFEYLNILDHIKSLNPDVKFLLENVKMKKEHLNVISSMLKVEPVFINSSICSPCERPRFYWANWFIDQPNSVDCDYMQFIDDYIVMGGGWRKWWAEKGGFQQKKKYSRIIKAGSKGITMTARQYANWNGNFIPTPEGLAKPGKKTLARLAGADPNYFDCVSQRQAEIMTGNGWTVNVIAHILRSM